MVHKILRYEVPVDGKVHEFFLSSELVLIATRHANLVEFWTIHTEGKGLAQRFFYVVGTGQDWSEHDRYLGTAIVPNIRLVWHLIERLPNGTK